MKKKDHRGRLFVKKRCDRCGHVEAVRPAQRRCHRRKFGPRSYCCWGKLERVPGPVRGARRTVREAIQELAAQGAAEEAAVQAAAQAGRRPQDAAQKKLDHARSKVTEVSRKIARLSTSLRMWERRATHYAKRASMTDAEVAADRERRKQRQARRPARRGIKLGGVQ